MSSYAYCATCGRALVDEPSVRAHIAETLSREVPGSHRISYSPRAVAR